MAIHYDMKFVKSFSRYDQKKLRYSALTGCLLISLSFILLLKPYLGPRPILNLQLSMRGGLSMLTIENKSSSQQLVTESEKIQKRGSLCNISDPRSDVWEMDGDIRMDGNSSNIVLASPQMGISAGNETWKIRPYARKGDPNAMADVNEISLKSVMGHEQAPHCSVNHSVPAIVFSIAGYTGNLFHDFSDVLIPLFMTSRQFQGEVQFLITNTKPWWINKYRAILNQLSKFEIIDFDRDESVHCFGSALVGLRCHKELSIDPLRSPNRYSMPDFTKFLRSSYKLERETAIRIGDDLAKKPKLLIISRRRSRTFTNVGDIVAMAESLGYEVVVAEANVSTNMAEFAQIVNSCDAMLGVHGAGLANLVFLPPNAVLIQIVPWGRLETFARIDFGDPAMDMKIKYLEYRIEERESTLIEQYPHDHLVFENPIKFHKQGWQAIKSVFLDKQNVTLDVGRFRGTLWKALELLQQ